MDMDGPSGISLTANGAVTTILIDSPKKANALDLRSMLALNDALRNAYSDPDCSVLVIKGGGDKYFCSGADQRESKSAAEAAAFKAALLESLALIAGGPKLVVSAVRGAAVGVGAMLALAADRIVMAQDAYLSFPELKIGMPSVLAYDVLRESFSESFSLHLLLTGERLGASEAHVWGLKVCIVQTHELHSYAAVVAANLATLHASAVGSLKAGRAELRLHRQRPNATNAFSREVA